MGPQSIFKATLALLLSLSASLVLAQKEDGYIGYHLEHRGDPESAIYETANTDVGGVPLSPDPDVYLNASVHVGLIDIEVDNITAKINLDAQVLKLLHFTAGVDASIDRVKLTIENVSAKVELEARLENVVEMVNDVLHSIDLNPIVATLGQSVKKIVNNTVGGLTEPVDSSGNPTKTTGAEKRDFDLGHDYNLAHNILYSINDYEGKTHTNRVLAQNGTIYDVFLNNNGDETGRTQVGYYSKDMHFGDHNRTISVDGEPKEYEMEYIYAPFPGLEVTAWIYMNTAGKITKTRLISEATGGGMSTISDDEEEELRMKRSAHSRNS
ncbi:uncharacterized protein E0L32_010384 [Thyridium curvatum]|uniref:Uncharacterized protein n=1 Tax=Thyridium curvatum TaxID=1093900 RepID=A0A507ASP5_9PEZI|nr:uncharacterized protein E0L32_010384 [Thyridium curvatum]TPX07929.1 hypothetical protein E0L32_010384 [Thyridium curvatum]